MRLGQAAACAAIAALEVGLAGQARAAGAPAPPAPEAPLPPLSEARPPPPPEPAPARVPGAEHIEVGGGVAFAQALVSKDGLGNPTAVRFRPGVGFHIDLSWQVFRYLRFTGYLVEHTDSIVIPPNALVPGPFNLPAVHTYSFGFRISPTLPIGPRVRLWVTAGGGWGHVAYDYFTQAVPMGTPSPVNPTLVFPGRSVTLFEIPFGLGGSIVIIPRWLSAHVELLASVAPSQTGDALSPGQYIDASGKMQSIGPFPKLDVTFVQTFGLSLHL